jgi:membrane-anchored glycerophosphoryl diester phosphodiesterase (GDPDase)
VLWIPLISVAFLAGLVNSSLFYLVMMLGLVIFVFIVTYLSLSIPAIVFANRTVIKAIRESISLVHNNLSSILSLLIIVVLIGSVTNLLWHLADNGSWMTLISIAGNAFISTALVMAIFIYYRDHEAQQLQTLT